MNWKKHFLEGITLVVAAVICAMVSNGIAARERKMTLVGTYPNALKVPAQQPEATPNVATGFNPSNDGLKPVATSTVATSTDGLKPVATSSTVATSPVATTTTAKPTKPPAPPPAPAPKPDLSKFAQHPDKPYIEIAYADVNALHAAGALFLDARRTSIYEQGHIAGARPFSVWESDIDQKVNNLFSERPDANDQAKPIVVYCSGGECEDSHMLATKLHMAGFDNALVYKDGFPDWQKRGLPVHTGDTP